MSTPPAIAPIITYVNESPDRYKALCHAFVEILARVKLADEDKQDVFSDLSDILDGMPPSPRSGYVKSDPRKRG